LGNSPIFITIKKIKMTIKKIFDEIANEPSTNKKMQILTGYKDVELLSKVLYLACSKRIKYYLKQIPDYNNESATPETLQWALNGLELISSRKYTGNDAILWLRTILSNLSHDDAYIIERIIEKDCKIGMGTSNINKVFTKLIEDTPYMGAKSFNEKLARAVFKDGPAYSQIKMDGRYCNAIIRSGEVELESRQGEPTILTGAKFLSELTQFGDCVLNGELTMDSKEVEHHFKHDDGGITVLTMDSISRYESNGIVASLVSIGKKQLDGEDVTKEIKKFEDKHMGYQAALDAIRFTVWDRIEIQEYFDAKSKLPYHERLTELSGLLTFKYNCSMVSLIENKQVKTYEEAMTHFQDVLNKGFEGTILKAGKGEWKDGKPNWCVKLKKEINLDLVIKGFNYGTGKNKDVISSIDVESSEGLLKTSPTGINESMMKFITENQNKLLNTIVEVKCSGLSQDSEGNYSVLHPVFKLFRDDKSVANSLNECIQIDRAAMGLS
jgi:ATP-dependent DNA ligase